MQSYMKIQFSSSFFLINSLILSEGLVLPFPVFADGPIDEVTDLPTHREAEMRGFFHVPTIPSMITLRYMTRIKGMLKVTDTLAEAVNIYRKRV